MALLIQKHSILVKYNSSNKHFRLAMSKSLRSQISMFTAPTGTSIAIGLQQITLSLDKASECLFSSVKFYSNVQVSTVWAYKQNVHSKMMHFLKNGPLSASFIYFRLFNTANVEYWFLPMTGFEPRTSGILSNRSTNWATTTLPTEPHPLPNNVIF